MSLRIIPATAGASLANEKLDANTESVPAPDADGYFSRLAKLIPSESLGLYVTVTSLITATSGKATDANLLRWLAVLAALAMTVLIRLQATRDSAGQPQHGALLISVVSCGLWIAALPEGSRPWLPKGETVLYPVLAVIWSGFAARLYRG